MDLTTFTREARNALWDMNQAVEEQIAQTEKTLAAAERVVSACHHTRAISRLCTLVGLLVALPMIGYLMFLIQRTRSLAEPSRRIELLAMEIQELEDRGDLDGAIARCNEHLGSRPNDAWVREILMRLYWKKGDYDSAARELDAIEQIDPTWHSLKEWKLAIESKRKK